MGTKPPWPTVDGGRLVAWYTLQALAQAGHEITLVAPIDPARADRASAETELGAICRPSLVAARPSSFAMAAARGLVQGNAASITRHTLPAVRAEVARLVAKQRFDVVHAEQVQALAQCEPAFAAGLRVVWRAQNVESDLWLATARYRWWLGPLLRREARRMAEAEAAAVQRTAATIALTQPDAERLGALSGVPDRIHHVPAPFPAELPAADQPLPGAPAVVLFGSGGWWPNAHGARWFLREAWPVVRRTLPEAQLHVFGMRGPHTEAVSYHPAPADSREAFAPGSILAVPLFVASGVRMKILEAWARGVPVVATPAAATGLECDRALMVATDAGSFAERLGEIRGSEKLRLDLVAEARRRLQTAHDRSLLTTLVREMGGSSVPSTPHGSAPE